MSTTPNLLISHIATSQNNKEITANTAFDDFDGAITGQFSAAMADADFTPTADQAHYNAVFLFTGTDTAVRNFIVPSTKKFYLVKNNTVGSFGVQVKTSGGSGITVLQSDGYTLVYCDGTNVVLISAYGTGSEGIYAAFHAQFNALSNVALYVAPIDGLYAISYAAKQTQLDTVSSSLGGTNGFQVKYTDADDSQTPTTHSGPFDTSNALTAQVNGVVVVNAKAGSTIFFNFDYTSGSGGPSAFEMEYALHIRVKKV